MIFPTTRTPGEPCYAPESERVHSDAITSSCKYPGILLVSLEMLAYALWAGTSITSSWTVVTHAVCAHSAAVSTIRVHALTKGFWPLSLLTLALALVPLGADMVSPLVATTLHTDPYTLARNLRSGSSQP